MAKGKKGLVGRETSESAAENVEDPKPKQTSLAGMEDRAISEIEIAAEEYVEIRDERMEMTKKEVEARSVVAETMRKHKKSQYHRNGLTITISSGDEKVKVKKEKEE